MILFIKWCDVSYLLNQNEIITHGPLEFLSLVSYIPFSSWLYSIWLLNKCVPQTAL